MIRIAEYAERRAAEAGGGEHADGIDDSPGADA